MKINSFRRVARLIIFSFTSSATLFAAKECNHDFKEKANLAVIITGQVVDENSKPIGGVPAQLKNLKAATTTNQTCSFTKEGARQGFILAFTYIGFYKQEVVGRYCAQLNATRPVSMRKIRFI